MEKFIRAVERVMLPFSEKVSKLVFLQALAQTMQIVLPVTVVGGFATLLAFIDVGFWSRLLEAVPILPMIFMTIQSLTISIISLYIVLVLPYRYALQLKVNNPFGVLPINVACFLLITPTQLYTSIPSEWLGHKGMFAAMIVSFLVVRIYQLFMNKGLTIKMPESVPQYVSDAFSALLPALVIVPVFGVIGQLMTLTPFGNLHQMIYDLIQAPLKGVGSSFGSFMLYVLTATLSFFVGIHGMSTTSVWAPITNANNMENIEAFSQGLVPPNIFDAGTVATTWIGGMGSCLGAVLVIVLLTKSRRMKQLGKVSLVPMIFNICEPVLFGLPIMLNPLLFIPYVSCNLLNAVIAWVTRATGLVLYTGLDPSWTIPMVFKAFFISQTPVRVAILQAILIVLNMIIWYPFLRILDRQFLREEGVQVAIPEKKLDVPDGAQGS